MSTCRKKMTTLKMYQVIASTKILCRCHRRRIVGDNFRCMNYGRKIYSFPLSHCCLLIFMNHAISSRRIFWSSSTIGCNNNHVLSCIFSRDSSLLTLIFLFLLSRIFSLFEIVVRTQVFEMHVLEILLPVGTFF